MVDVFETYRMLGEQREQELHREAQRLHAGTNARAAGRRPSARRLRAIAAFSVTALAKVRHVGRAAAPADPVG
jgi:hypothetical protein